MQPTALTSQFKKPQLFLRKNIIVKFSPTNSYKKGGSVNRNTETTTSITYPTGIISSNPY
jgi:hypothetical protein